MRPTQDFLMAIAAYSAAVDKLLNHSVNGHPKMPPGTTVSNEKLEKLDARPPVAAATQHKPAT